MEIVLGLLVIGFLYYWFVIRKTIAWNADPRQQLLAQMFIAAATGDARKPGEIIIFISKEGWAAREAKRRIIHALSIVKVASTPDVYQAAKFFGQQIHQVY